MCINIDFNLTEIRHYECWKIDTFWKYFHHVLPAANSRFFILYSFGFLKYESASFAIVGAFFEYCVDQNWVPLLPTHCPLVSVRIPQVFTQSNLELE